MHNHSDFLSQAAKINQNFRKEIRRRDIDRRFSERRKQLIEQIKNAKDEKGAVNNQSIINQVNYIIDESTEDDNRIISQFQKIYKLFISNNALSNEGQLKILAGISCTITGAKLILSIQIKLLMYLQAQFILKQSYNNSRAQGFALLIFSNCLAIADIDYTIDSNLKYANLNQLTTEQSFLFKLFSISLESDHNRSKVNALSCIFNILYNNDCNFVQMLVINPKFNIMSLLANHMHTEPKQQQVAEVFRIFYIIMKKLQFPPLDQFGKMRKFVINALKMSNNKQVTTLGIVCVYGLLTCLPNEKGTLIKSGILTVIYNQAINLNNHKIVIHALRIATLVLSQKTDQESKLVIEQVVSFVEAVVNVYNSDKAYCMSFKIIYQILMHTQYNCDALISNHKRLINKMMQIFSSNLTNKEVLLEIANILPVIAFKARNTIQKGLVLTIKARLKQLLQINCFDEINNKYLQQSLSILHDSDELNQYL